MNFFHRSFEKAYYSSSVLLQEVKERDVNSNILNCRGVAILGIAKNCSQIAKPNIGFFR